MRIALGLGMLAFAAGQTLVVENARIAVRLEAGANGVALTSIRNKATGVEHLARPSALFEFTANQITAVSSGRVSVDAVKATAIEASARDLPLKFGIDVSAPGDEAAVVVAVRVTNSGPEKLSVRAVVPRINGIVTGGMPASRMGMIPAEIGTVVPLEGTAPRSPIGPVRKPPIGMLPNPQIGMPTGMNSMEVASVYDADGKGGVFFADIDGDLDHDVAPIQFTLSDVGVAGSWVGDLKPGETARLPRFAIGVHDSGDWHAAVDYYVAKHRPRWRFAPIPAWLRDQGAIYGYSGGGAGGIYLMYPGQDLKDRIRSFEELPKLLDEAQRFGTNIVYIWGYWEESETAASAYSNKGDYVPRADLGGVPAFVKGVKALQDRGGKLIVYVEPFLVHYGSRFGKEKGPGWAGRDASGNLYTHYRNGYSMVAPHVPWQDYMVKVCERLVREYGVDGIFLDSWSWQTNWPMQAREEGILYSGKEYSKGILTMTDRVLKAVQAIKPDAVVIGETTAGPIARHWHGGLSADFAWLGVQNQERIVASPVRYGVPEVNFVTNGRTLGELNQVFAAGHALALANSHLAWAPYVKALVEVRQKYKDALVYGAQKYQPATGSADAAAYYYEGARHRVVTAVNLSTERHYTGALTLRDEKDGVWEDPLTGEPVWAKGGKLPLLIPPSGLRVLVRQ